MNLLNILKSGLKGYRKFIAYMVVLGFSTILLIKGYINGDNYASIIGSGIVAFVTANTFGDHEALKGIFGEKE